MYLVCALIDDSKRSTMGQCQKRPKRGAATPASLHERVPLQPVFVAVYVAFINFDVLTVLATPQQSSSA
jgi:hypothetical protein